MFTVCELASPESFVVRNPVLSVTLLSKIIKRPLPFVHLLLGSGLELREI